VNLLSHLNKQTFVNPTGVPCALDAIDQKTWMEKLKKFFLAFGYFH
jgi:hypothetical protein